MPVESPGCTEASETGVQSRLPKTKGKEEKNDLYSVLGHPQRTFLPNWINYFHGGGGYCLTKRPTAQAFLGIDASSREDALSGSLTSVIFILPVRRPPAPAGIDDSWNKYLPSVLEPARSLFFQRPVLPWGRVHSSYLSLPVKHMDEFSMGWLSLCTSSRSSR